MTARRLDQFYTREDVARLCIDRVGRYAGRLATPLFVEPAAGAGAFFNQLPASRVGMDLDPKCRGILKQDFLQWRPERSERPIVVVGNPPFGKNASLAVRFFNHAAQFADIIALIVPLTFQKQSTWNKLDRGFMLVEECLLAEYSFVFDDCPYDVPTVFQIWKRGGMLRPLERLPTRHGDFSFVAAPQAEFAFQRVGARAGLVSEEGLRKSPQSHYFIKPTQRAGSVRQILASIDWTPIKCRTAGNPSIGKAELIAAYSAALSE